jgi:hypothetical protein
MQHILRRPLAAFIPKYTGVEDKAKSIKRGGVGLVKVAVSLFPEKWY